MLLHVNGDGLCTLFVLVWRSLRFVSLIAHHVNQRAWDISHDGAVDLACKEPSTLRLSNDSNGLEYGSNRALGFTLKPTW